MRRAVYIAGAAMAGAALLAVAVPVLAQDEAAERSRLITYVEEVLSTPDRQIRLNGLDGALSSNVSMDSITIADEDGIWLTVTQPELVWNRLALLRGRLSVDSLTAQRIDITRLPEGEETAPSPEAGGFALPELPVSVIIDTLDIETVSLGEPVVGIAAEVALEGMVNLSGGSLMTDIAIQRLDGPGGQLDLDIAFDGDEETLELNIALEEPANGIVANSLNLTGAPPVSLLVQGEGPVDELTVTLAADVDANRIAEGLVSLTGTETGLQAIGALDAELGPLVPPSYSALFDGTSAIRFDARFADSGAIQLQGLTIDSGVLGLEASARRLDDGFLEALNVDAQLAGAPGQIIEIGGDDTMPPLRLAGGALQIAFDGAVDDRVAGQLVVDRLDTGSLGIDAVDVRLDGTLDARAPRSLGFTVSGGAQGISATDPDLARALGAAISIDGNGSWMGGQPLMVDAFDIEGESYALRLTGDVGGPGVGLVYNGQIGLQANDLTSFAPLLDREMSGSAALVLDGSVALLSGAFDVFVTGVGNDVAPGGAALNALFAGQTQLSGGVARGGEGLAFEKLRLTNAQLDTVIDGSFASETANMTVNAQLRDLGDVSDSASGSANATVALTGNASPFDLDASLAMDSGTLAGKAVSGLTARFDGQMGEAFGGTVSTEGFLDGEAVLVQAQISADETRTALSDLDAAIGASRIAGAVERSNETGLIDGTLSLASSDISALAALALTEASGAVNADIAMQADGATATQAAAISASANGVTVGETRIGSAEIEARLTDLFGTIGVNASIDGARIEAGGVGIGSLNANAQTSGNVTGFDLRANLDETNATVEARGAFTQQAAGGTLRLDQLDVRSPIANAALQAPAEVQFADGVTTIPGAALNVGGGSLRVSGTAGDRLDMRVAIAALPLAIANAVQPDLGLSGTLDATLNAVGPSNAPQVQFDVSGSGVTMAQLSQPGLSPLGVRAQGAFDGGANAVTLSQFSASNAQELAIAGSGRIPLDGGSMQVAAEGGAPLALAQQFVADRGTQISGLTRFSIAATGPVSAPVLDGQVSVSDARVRDPLSNLSLTEVGVVAGISGQQVTIQSVNGNLETGGSISGSGTVGIGPDLPADLVVELSNARYTDGQTFATTLDGTMTLTGSLARDPLLAGTLNLAETEIIVPETFGSSDALLDVTHIDPDAATQQTLDRVAQANPLPTPGRRPSILQLDITINAPSRIFVRGRGLDAELGGALAVRGPVTNVIPTGGFTLRRGRLDILGTRIDLDEGSITLSGDLDPFLDFVARTQSGDVTAFVQLRGRASALDVTFSSVPELPQDEVLARILFDRGVGDLSPLQIAQLASAAAELTGGSSPDLVGGLREGLGLDDLDIVEDSEGNAAVQAGRYISDNVYLGVETGSETEATINLDITDNLTARGSVDTSGESELGIFFERDY